MSEGYEVPTELPGSTGPLRLILALTYGILPSSAAASIYLFKGAVYTVWIFISICMSLRVFKKIYLNVRKKNEILKRGIHCISQVFAWHFCFMREHSLVELTEYDDSAANIMVHSMTYMYCCIHSRQCVSIMNGRRSGTREKSCKQALD